MIIVVHQKILNHQIQLTTLIQILAMKLTEIISLTPSEFKDLVAYATHIPVCALNVIIQSHLKEFKVKYVMIISDAISFRIFVNSDKLVMLYYNTTETDTDKEIEKRLLDLNPKYNYYIIGKVTFTDDEGFETGEYINQYTPCKLIKTEHNDKYTSGISATVTCLVCKETETTLRTESKTVVIDAGYLQAL